MRKLSIIALISCILIAMVIASCSKEKEVEPEVDPEVVVAQINAIFEEEGTQEYLGDIVLGMPWPGQEFMIERGYVKTSVLRPGGYYHPQKEIYLMFFMYPDVIDSNRLVYIGIDDSPVKFLGMSPFEGDFSVREDLPEGLYQIRGEKLGSGTTTVRIELLSTNKTDKKLPNF